MSDDIHALVGAYALDAVDDLQRAAFDRHLRDCEACRAEVAELQATAARLADGTWSVPPPGLRDRVMAEIATTRQVTPTVAARRRRPGSLRLRLTAAAAAVLAAATAGTAVFVVQEQRVRHEQAIADATRSGPSRAQAILAAPDLVVRQEPLTTGGHLIVATSHLRNAGVILLAADEAPADGKVLEAWTVGSQGPTPAGTGRTAVLHIIENLAAASAVAVTVEPAPGTDKPTGSTIGTVKLT